MKILNLYTPLNEFEERVTVSFIRNIQVGLWFWFCFVPVRDVVLFLQEVQIISK